MARTDTALRGPGGSGVGILTALVLVATVPAGCSRSLRPAALDEDDVGDAGGPRADAAGADSDSGATDGEDGGPPPTADCPAMDATLVLCPPPPPVPRPPVPAAWVDDRCIEIPPGSCAGEDCDDLYRGLAACEAATAGCDAALCRTTGGRWKAGEAYCEQYTCGLPSMAKCLWGVGICNCGAGAAWVPGEGCRPHPAGADPCLGISEQDRCAANGGTVGAGGSCACRWGQRFEAAFGCVPDVPTDCGRRDCPQPRGAPCDGPGLCQAGLVCCGTGRPDPSTCRDPVCGPDGDPFAGCNLE